MKDYWLKGWKILASTLLVYYFGIFILSLSIIENEYVYSY